MEPKYIRWLLGGLINLEIWLFLAINMLCLACIYRGRLHAQKDNPVYVISGLNIITESIQLVLHAVYIGPSILLGDWLFESRESPPVLIIAYIFLLLWFTGSLTQIAMAINRLCVVCFPSWKLTRKHMLIIFFVLQVCALVMVTYSEVLSPCCKITPDYNYFGISYLPVVNATRNYSLEYVDVPIDIVTSTVCGISYLIVFRYLKKMGQQGDLQLKRREIRLCLQFLAVFLAYNITWVSFFALPPFGVTEPAAYSITSFALVCNCGINAVVYLLMNKDIKVELYRLLRVKRPIVTDSATPNRHNSNNQKASVITATQTN